MRALVWLQWMVCGARRPLRADPVRTCAAGIVQVPEGRRPFANLTVTELGVLLIRIGR